jgi:hypothetical protein
MVILLPLTSICICANSQVPASFQSVAKELDQLALVHAQADLE